jgi:catechol 2,3-dioxygenase-like lactoylglutathione lyase family enzyme
MVKTRGLTHINLAVRDAERSLQFYRQVFGVEAYWRADGMIHAKTPGAWDVITFDEGAPRAGETALVVHFGFRLLDPNDIDQAVTEVKQAGGTVLRQGEFAPGFPYAYVSDPDGYEVEIWFE